MNTNIPVWMQSSVDPSVVSGRVKGAVLALSSIIILLAGQFFHLHLSANDVISLASELGAVAGSIWTIKGAIIWILSKFGKKPVVTDSTPAAPVTPVV